MLGTCSYGLWLWVKKVKLSTRLIYSVYFVIINVYIMLLMMCVFTGSVISVNTTIRIHQFLNLNKVFGVGLTGKYILIRWLQLEVDDILK